MTAATSASSSWSAASHASTLAAVEAVDVVVGRDGRDELAVLAERGEHHEGAHGRHERVLGRASPTTCTTRAPAATAAAAISAAGAPARLDGAGDRLRRADERLQALDERGGVEVLGAVGLDRVDGRLERVEALEQDVDRGAVEAAAALAQQLEDVLHLVRERRHALEAHRRAHALQGVRDAEDLVDRLAVVGRLLDPDDGEVELLEVLAGLGQEHREVLGDVHQIFR